jgi:formylmethanofuran dehydrogenase subunit E
MRQAAMPTELANPQLDELLRQAGALHKHLCPRQVLGVRLGMYAAQIFPGALPQTNKCMLAMVEMDGCFADGVTVSTGCSLGHRTMRLADEGKIAVTFIDTRDGRAVRLFAMPDLRTRAHACVPGAASRWHAYLEAYKQFPVEEMFGRREVALNFDLKALIGRPGARSVCANCGEEILNLREIVRDGRTLCQSCAGASYWTAKD